MEHPKETAPVTMTAHRWEIARRTDDVQSGEKINFTTLLLSDEILQGLKQAGFERPSPIQSKAIPLGRCGFDLVVQAKSGTGKTCVFAVVALESIDLACSATQVLVLAPTREIAVQIQDVINAIGSCMTELACNTFIGGLPVHEDIAKLKKCHIAVGTPGRLKQLIENDAFNPESVRLFVLDEADKLMEQNFQEDINWIYSTLPINKQMMALSATYPESLARHITKYMRNPMFVRLNVLDPALLGVRQYSRIFPFQPVVQQVFDTKLTALIDLLSSVDFNQCLVFTNYQMRAQSLCDRLEASGWPAACISAAHDQHDRLKAMSQLKKFQCRILISTDLTARGIDAENVNLIVNFDVPRDHETYLHRVGRAGRFGTFGAAVSLVSGDQELKLLINIENRCHTSIASLPVPIPADLAKCSGCVSLDAFVTAERIATADDWEPTDFPIGDSNINQISPGGPTTTDNPNESQKLEQVSVCNGVSSSNPNAESSPKSEAATILCHAGFTETIMHESNHSEAPVVVDESSKDLLTIENCNAVDFDLVSFRDSDVLQNILKNGSTCFTAQNSESFSDIVACYRLHCDIAVADTFSSGFPRTDNLQARPPSVDQSLATNYQTVPESVSQFLAHSRFEYASHHPECASLLWPTSNEDNSTEDRAALPAKGSNGIESINKLPRSGTVARDGSCKNVDHIESKSKRCSFKNLSMSRDELLSYRESKAELGPVVIARVDELQLRRTDVAPASKLRKNHKAKSKHPANADVPMMVQGTEQQSTWSTIEKAADAPDKLRSTRVEPEVPCASALDSNNINFETNKPRTGIAVKSSLENIANIDSPSSVKPAPFSKEELLSFRDISSKPSPLIIAQVDELQLGKAFSRSPKTLNCQSISISEEEHRSSLPGPVTKNYMPNITKESPVDVIKSKNSEIESVSGDILSLDVNLTVESQNLAAVCPIEVVSGKPTDDVMNIMLLVPANEDLSKSASEKHGAKLRCARDDAAVCTASSSPIVETKTPKSVPVTRITAVTTESSKFKSSTSVNCEVNQSSSMNADSKRAYDFDKKILSVYVAAGLRDKLPRSSTEFSPALQKKDSREYEAGIRGRRVPPPTCQSSSDVTSSGPDEQDSTLTSSHRRAMDGKTPHGLGEAAHSDIRLGREKNSKASNNRTRRKPETRKSSNRIPGTRRPERGSQDIANDFWDIHANGLYECDPWWSASGFGYGHYDAMTTYSPDYHSGYLIGARDAYDQMARHFESVRRQSLSYLTTSRRISQLWQQQASYIREMARTYVDADH